MNSNSKTILLVEDEELVLKLVVKVLEMRGYQVLKATTSLQAVLVSGAHVGPIDLLLADLELDETMNGCELAKVLRRARPGLRVLYTSGYSLDNREMEGDMVRKEMQELLSAFLPKPFTPSSLTENVRRALEARPV
jgi:two-component system, cell cycle sensor histidine kinase and response regulator CckA